MKKYTLTVLTGSDLKSEQVDAISTKVEKMVKALSGTVGRTIELGKKQLSYKIKGSNDAMFLSWSVELPGSSVIELERKLTVDKEIVRHLLVLSGK